MKKITTTIYLLCLLLYGVNSAWAITVTARVSSNNDDWEEQDPVNNRVSRTSTDLELAYDGNTRQHIGMRFQALSIPAGATINSAYIEFEVDEADSGTTDVVIYGEDTDDAGAFNGANNISRRTRTSASIDWSIPAWNIVNSKQRTPDITQVIQEIISRNGWSSGNDLAIIIEPGIGCDSSSCQRTAESHNGESANAPLLVIDYTILPSAEYRLDELSWSGVAGEVVDATGNGNNGVAVSNPANTDISPAISGNPGTCRYADFTSSNRQYIEIPNSSDLNPVGDFTVTFWVRVDGGAGRYRAPITSRWINSNSSQFRGYNFYAGRNNHWEFWTAGGGNRWYKLHGPDVIMNSWTHIALTFSSTSNTDLSYTGTKSIYVNGGTPTVRRNQRYYPNDMYPTIIGAGQNATGYANGFFFEGAVDEFRVYSSALHSDQINTIMNETRPCSAIDHYAISHSRTGVTCEAESVTVIAHDANHDLVVPPSTTTINLATSIGNDGWALGAGNGTFSAPSAYTFDGSETSVRLLLTKTTATIAPHIDIDITDGVITDLDNAGQEDYALAFSDTALRFYADGNHNAIGTQIAGKLSTVTPGNQALTLRAVQTNTDTGVCEARLSGSQTVQMAFECVTPSNCQIANGVSITDSSSGVITAINGNPQGNVSSFADVDLLFDANGTAQWALNYQDAGQLALQASLSIAASAIDPADTLVGSSNVFTSKPAGLCVSSTDINADCASSDANCSGFKRAGEAFNLDIRAVAWESSLEADSAFCSGNTTTPNFQLNDITLNLNLIEPSTGSVGALGITSFNFDPLDNGVHHITTQSISEVGVFTVNTPNINYFLETNAIAASTSNAIGRFYPDHFELSNAVLTNRSGLACAPASPFTYMDENFTLQYELEAMNTNDAITQNYTTASGFAKLNNSQLDIGAVDLTAATELTNRLNITTGALTFTNGTVSEIDSLSFNRQAIGPDGEFQVSVGIAPEDDDGVTLNTFDLDVVGADGINEHAIIGAETSIYYGRTTVTNAFGSELVPLTIAVRTDYFDSVSSTFMANGSDNCTPYNTATDIDLTVASYTAPLVSINLSLSGAGVLTGGVARFSMHDDTDPLVGPGVTGDVTYNLQVPPYLKFDWNTVTPGDEDPSAKATFGIYQGNSKQIYYRQIYR